MKFPTALILAKCTKRYKRFFMGCVLKSNSLNITAHIANTGSLKGVFTEGDAAKDCLLSYSNDPKRKLKYSLQMIKSKKSWIGVNTHLANTLFWEKWEDYQKLDKKLGKSHFFNSYEWAQKEVKINEKTRLDFVFHKKKKTIMNLAQQLSKKPVNPDKIKWNIDWLQQEKFHFIEVKNVSMARKDIATFPDAKTSRGLKHINELLDLKKQGHSVELIFIVQRSDCNFFQPAKDIDPEYSLQLKKAYEQGLKINAFSCVLSKDGIDLNIQNPLKLLW